MRVQRLIVPSGLRQQDRASRQQDRTLRVLSRKFPCSTKAYDSPSARYSDDLAELILDGWRSSTDCTNPFSNLPLEIVHQIVLGADLKTILTLRRVSLYTRQLVNSVPEFAFTINVALPLMEHLAVTRSLSAFTLQEIVDLLYTEVCHICGESGARKLHLALKARCCEDCLLEGSYNVTMVPADCLIASSVMSRGVLENLKYSTTAFGVKEMEHEKDGILAFPARTIIDKWRRSDPHGDWTAFLWSLEHDAMQYYYFLTIVYRLPSVKRDGTLAAMVYRCEGCHAYMLHGQAWQNWVAYDTGPPYPQEGWEKLDQAIPERTKVYDKEDFLLHVSSCRFALFRWISYLPYGGS